MVADGHAFVDFPLAEIVRARPTIAQWQIAHAACRQMSMRGVGNVLVAATSQENFHLVGNLAGTDETTTPGVQALPGARVGSPP